jgi:hypothetical protein
MEETQFGGCECHVYTTRFSLTRFENYKEVRHPRRYQNASWPLRGAKLPPVVEALLVDVRAFVALKKWLKPDIENTLELDWPAPCITR